jgi:glycosyltransferase involved in cell wall biosynthesis
MRDAYSNASIFLAPMRIGSGMQNKLLESMSMGLPCITTALAANALDAQNGRELLVRESNQDIADAIVHLLQSPNEAKSLGEHAREYVKQHHDWSATIALLNQLLLEK